MGNGDVVFPTTGEFGHRVKVPPPQPFFKSLKTSFKETFFPDDPLRQFKNKTASKKLVLGLQHFLPILEWAPRYTFSFFKADLVAGITIASLAIPQGISYAKLANLPPILGLCMILVFSKTGFFFFFWFLGFLRGIERDPEFNFLCLVDGQCRFQLCAAFGLCYDG